MIVHITPGTARLKLRIKEATTANQLTDWRQLQLLIEPGQRDTQGCGPNGSPWVLTGCWPGHRTGVDIANPIPNPNIPIVCYQAHELDPDGRIVFRLDNRFLALPYGRYTGTVRIHPRTTRPFNLLPVGPDGTPVKPIPPSVPPEYLTGNQNCSPVFNEPAPPTPPSICRDIVRFDLDLGDSSTGHYIDQSSVDFALDSCGGFDDGDS